MFVRDYHDIKNRYRAIYQVESPNFHHQQIRFHWPYHPWFGIRSDYYQLVDVREIYMTSWRKYLPERCPEGSSNWISLTALPLLDWTSVPDPFLISDWPASIKLINILLPSKHNKFGLPRASRISLLIGNDNISTLDREWMIAAILQNMTLLRSQLKGIV